MDSPCSLEALHSNTRMSSCALPLGYMAARTLRHSNLSGQARPVLGPGMLMSATGSAVINHFWREISRDAPSQCIQAELASRRCLAQALCLSWQAIRRQWRAGVGMRLVHHPLGAALTNHPSCANQRHRRRG